MSTAVVWTSVGVPPTGASLSWSVDFRNSCRELWVSTDRGDLKVGTVPDRVWLEAGPGEPVIEIDWAAIHREYPDLWGNDAGLDGAVVGER